MPGGVSTLQHFRRQFELIGSKQILVVQKFQGIIFIGHVFFYVKVGFRICTNTVQVLKTICGKLSYIGITFTWRISAIPFNQQKA